MNDTSKVAPILNMIKAYRVNRGKESLILNLGTRFRRLVIVILRKTLSKEIQELLTL
jgi:hypothetical protein